MPSGAVAKVDQHTPPKPIRQLAYQQTMESLIIPVYRNADTIPDLIEALSALQRRMSEPAEVVFVVDGSPDACEAMLRQRLPLVSFPSQLVCHSRNFGSFAAVRTGLACARGDRLAVMAADLQEPISLIVEFFQILREEPYDVCVGTRISRDDPLKTRLSSEGFWFLFRRLVMPSMPAGGIDVFACTRNVAKVLTELEESHSSLVAQIIWIGFRRKEVPYSRLARRAGRSGWTLKRRIDYMLDSVFSFTDRPLQLISVLGTLGMVFCLAYGTVVVVARLGGWIKEAGYAALAVLILFSMFFNLFSLGIVGQYVWRTFENSKGRPLAIIRDVTCFDPALSGSAKD
jgi:glycosyltransferase involved in cell wall biosynthesis